MMHESWPDMWMDVNRFGHAKGMGCSCECIVKDNVELPCPCTYSSCISLLSTFIIRDRFSGRSFRPPFTIMHSPPDMDSPSSSAPSSPNSIHEELADTVIHGSTSKRRTNPSKQNFKPNKNAKSEQRQWESIRKEDMIDNQAVDFLRKGVYNI